MISFNKMHVKLRSEATLESSVIFEGIGVHSGLPVKMNVCPAPENSGIVFRRVDIVDRDNLIKLSPESVVDPIMCTKVVNANGVSVSVIEHLLAAFRISGITNAIVDVDSHEVPILDGSAIVFVKAFKNAGISYQSSKVPAIFIKRQIIVENGAGRIEISPSKHKRVSVELSYDRVNAVIGANNKFEFDLDASMLNIAEARTFGWAEDCEKIKAAGMARGASEENTVVIMPNNSIGNVGGLRNPRELVMHKCLDLLGDISIVGYDIIGSITGVNTSHSLNNILMRKMLKEISAHEIVEECVPESFQELNLATC